MSNYPLRIPPDLKPRLREAARRDGFRDLSKWLLWLAKSRAQETEPKGACAECGNPILESGTVPYCCTPCYMRFTPEGFFGIRKENVMHGPSPEIERTEPMRIHKSVVITQLRLHPEDRDKLIPDWSGSVEDFIAELERRPGEWFVGGTFQES